MQFNKTLKALLVALPVMALAACSSSTKVDDSDATQTNTADTNQASTVEVNTIKKEPTAEEKLQEKYKALRQTQVVYFDFDKSTVQREFVELLQAHADFLVKNSNVKVLIEGHADERGTPEYNIALGESRGKAVAKYLQSLGVSDNQLSVVSYGEEKPEVKSRTEEAFAKNRRAVLVY
jgi:peptidoglycan-associated lipoprotein